MKSTPRPDRDGIPDNLFRRRWQRNLTDMTHAFSKQPVRLLWEQLPPEYPDSLLPQIRHFWKQMPHKIVVLDDDPTGTQTVQHVPVLTQWNESLLTEEFTQPNPLFFILTNSRSLLPPDAQAINRDIIRTLEIVSRKTGKPYTLISRSDSTLRGHFPAELDALEQELNHSFDLWLLVPFFLEGGRYTVNDTHYVQENDWLVPAGDTAFARDATFGYESSDLKDWVAEKMPGRITATQVGSVSLEDIRTGGVDRVAAILWQSAHKIFVVNAIALRDLEVLVAAVQQVQRRGKQILFRTAASFVQVYAGLTSPPLLSSYQLIDPAATVGGLTVVGSYVPKTTEQVQAALSENPELMPLEVPVQRLLDDSDFATLTRQIADAADDYLQTGKDVLIFTARTLVRDDDPARSLHIGNRVSQGLVKIVQNLSTKPRYLIAKGGITSSDLATQGLGVRRAWVLGQLLPGVPVWQTGTESRFPGLSYVVFPGNVGNRNALSEAIQKMKRPA